MIYSSKTYQKVLTRWDVSMPWKYKDTTTASYIRISAFTLSMQNCFFWSGAAKNSMSLKITEDIEIKCFIPALRKHCTSNNLPRVGHDDTWCRRKLYAVPACSNDNNANISNSEQSNNADVSNAGSSPAVHDNTTQDSESEAQTSLADSLATNCSKRLIRRFRQQRQPFKPARPNQQQMISNSTHNSHPRLARDTPNLPLDPLSNNPSSASCAKSVLPSPNLEIIMEGKQDIGIDMAVEYQETRHDTGKRRNSLNPTTLQQYNKRAVPWLHKPAIMTTFLSLNVRGLNNSRQIWAPAKTTKIPMSVCCFQETKYEGMNHIDHMLATNGFSCKYASCSPT